MNRRCPIARGLWFFGLVLLLLAPKCATNQVTIPPPTPSARDGGSVSNQYTAACAGMSRAGCPEAVPQCAATLQRTVNDRVLAPNLICLANAQTKADVRSCGKAFACP